MLSKLLYPNVPGRNCDEWVAAVEAALLVYLSDNYCEFSAPSRVQGGTLGVLFSVTADGRRRFVKTHLQGDEYRENLKKEYALLKSLYGARLEILMANVRVKNDDVAFLVMDWLLPIARAPSPDEVSALILRYAKRFFDVSPTVPAMYKFEQLHVKAMEAIDILYGAELLGCGVVSVCKELVGALDSNPESVRICHGDLSNKNIMQHNGELVIIDWEDAFYGPEAYDICYWLTFMEQRRLYRPGLIEGYGIPANTGISLMLMIVLLKSWLAYKNGSYKNNALSFENRVTEILAMR